MSKRTESAGTAPTPPASSDHVQITKDPGKPKASGYAEPKPTETTERGKPVPHVPGNEASQIAASLPDEDEEEPDDTEPTPPGEHKREPIKDPDPAETKQRVRGGAGS